MIDPSVSAFYIGDCRALLRQLPPRCAQTCVTSPPFWGLRDYEMDGQIGLELTPREYVRALVSAFRQVRRVLKDDGTLWLNLGDSYAGSRSGPQGESGEMADREVAKHRAMRGKTKGIDPKNPRKGPGNNNAPNRARQSGLKPKDLVGIPWEVAFALRKDGWYLRMDCIWSKPNPMPESVTDRPTKAHEYLFLFSKSPSYYYDAAAIAEPIVRGDNFRNITDPVPSAMPGAPAHVGLRKYKSGNKTRSQRSDNGGARDRATNQTFGVPWDADATGGMRNKRSVWTVDGAVDLELAREQAALWGQLAEGLAEPRQNKPSVFTVTPIPYNGDHFATYPPALIEPCILACSRPGDLVLDPFFGSGTTGEVAEKHERRWIGFDIQPKYADLARLRTAQRSLPLARSL